ncbi:MAG: C39 family peptidase [Cyanobacteriota bacterium]|nr:C39 family peptidase [Cyanobacteriota bacterium]
MRKLNVPYLSQINNVYHPWSACNVTSIAMCLLYRGIVGDRSHQQLEDQIYHRSREIGANRFTPEGIKAIVESYNRTNDLNLNGSLADIRKSIDEDAPVIIHGWFTEPGHIIVIKGYDENEKMFIVHDPYGEWFPWYYDVNTVTNFKGKERKYSYRAIAACCSSWNYYQGQDYYDDRSFIPEAAKEMWVHSIRPTIKN